MAEVSFAWAYGRIDTGDFTMTDLIFVAMPTEAARAYQSGAEDANGMPPERHISLSGTGSPCRHCLRHIAAGDAYLTLAYRPFSTIQPYAEMGPVFLHAEECTPYAGDDALPEVLTTSPDFILRGYDKDERIVYGTGAVTASGTIASRALELLSRDDIDFVHVRSARNNCYQCRIDRR